MLRVQGAVQLQRHIRIFRCVFGRALDRYLIEADAVRALAGHFIVTNCFY
jgi:hypothetical protein